MALPTRFARHRIFGHGESFTSFSYTGLQLANTSEAAANDRQHSTDSTAGSGTTVTQNGSVYVTFSVQNIGKVVGTEVAQVYVVAILFAVNSHTAL